MNNHRHFLELNKADIVELIAGLKQSHFRGKQLADWIFSGRALKAGDMKNLPGDLRRELTARLDWSLPEVVETISGDDHSTKLLMKTASGHHIESVLMRYDKRTSVCVSSQVGCRLSCSFCQTGKLGFARNLACHEIIAQYRLAAAMAAEDGRKISHVVFMGMGEPLDNYDETVAAAKLLTAKDCYALSPKHVTISTAGLPDRIRSLAGDVRVALAISLQAARDELRDELMPVNRRHPLAQLKEALLYYQKETGDKITFEYILIRDVTCTRREVKALVKFIHGLRAKVNLIPFNAHPGLPYEAPSPEEIRDFQSYLSARSIPAPVRYSRGSELSAACGQLAAKWSGELDGEPQRSRILPKKD